MNLYFKTHTYSLIDPPQHPDLEFFPDSEVFTFILVVYI